MDKTLSTTTKPTTLGSALTPTAPQTPQLDQSVVALSKAIRQRESGGNFNAKGKDGEMGAYQFLPSTWKMWAGEHLGNPNAPMTKENQNKVAYKQIKAWKDQGYNPGQIASLWNSGSPNNVTGSHSGTSTGGATYNTPEYVKDVYKYYNQFRPQDQTDPNAGATDAPTVLPTPNKTKSLTDALYDTSKYIAGAGFEAEKGIAKGAGSTIATVPSSVGKVFGEISDIGTQKNYNSAIEKLNKSNEQLLGLLKNIPKTDPRYKKYQDIIKSNLAQADKFRTEAKGAGEEATALGEKPDFLTPKGTAQNVGYGAEKVGEFIYGAKNLAAPAATARDLVPANEAVTLTQRLANIGLQSASQGVASGLVTAAQGGTGKEITKSAILSSIFSAPIQAISEFAPVVSGLFKESAEKNASQALGATTKVNKELSEKIVPELLDRRVTFLTRSGLESKAATEAEAVGEQIGTAWEKLPPETQVSIAPYIKQLEDAKGELTVTLADGSSQVPSAAMNKYQALQNIQQEIVGFAQKEDPSLPSVIQKIADHVTSAQQVLTDTPPEDIAQLGGEKALFDRIKTNVIDSLLKDESIPQGSKYAENLKAVDISGAKSVDEVKQLLSDAAADTPDTVSAKSLRAWRQIQDNIIAQKGKGFGLTGTESDALAVQKTGANAIRNVLNSDNPDIAKLNKEYTFWKNVQKVVGDTVTRTKSQGGLGEDIMEGAGAVTGAVVKGTFGGALLTATGFRLLQKAITSPAFRMASGVVKDTIADYLMSGNFTALTRVLNGLTSASASALSRQKK